MMGIALRAGLAGVLTASLLLGAASLPASQAARAESLRDALASAYRTNPTLNAERARLRATDEEVSQARSNLRPSVSASADAGRERTNRGTKSAIVSTFSPDGGTWPSGYSFTLNQSLFRGFRTLNQIRGAEASVRSGREDLRNVEQTVLLDAVTAYMDVVRDQAIVRLRENNVKVLSEQLTATKDRFEVGEVTKTDVAQAEARRAGAISQLNLAQSNLKTSRANYERIVGHPPSHLSDPPPIDRTLPNTLEEAIGVGEAENPAVLSAVYQEQAARHEVKQIIGEMLPSVSLEATYQERFDPTLTIESQETTTVTGRVTVPLYSKGEPSSRARQAREVVVQRQRQIDEARVRTRADVIAAWGRLTAARAQIESDESQVRANKIALNGVREEEKVGQRTVLDVLDAEQELLDAQVTLVGTRRDNVVAAFTLLSAVGRLDAYNLGLGVDHYDPTEHYSQVRKQPFGLNPWRTKILER